MKKKSLRGEAITKGYLTDELANFSEGLINQIDHRLDRKIDQVENKLDKKFDRVYISLDKVIKELQDIREEDAAGELQTRRLKKKVEDHESRIRKLETPN